MKLNEFFTYGADGFEQDKTYEPENDISILDSEDTRSPDGGDGRVSIL